MLSRFLFAFGVVTVPASTTFCHLGSKSLSALSTICWLPNLHLGVFLLCIRLCKHFSAVHSFVNVFLLCTRLCKHFSAVHSVVNDFLLCTRLCKHFSAVHSVVNVFMLCTRLCKQFSAVHSVVNVFCFALVCINISLPFIQLLVGSSREPSGSLRNHGGGGEDNVG